MFRKDNRIKYGQDSHQRTGIPSGVEFRVEPFKEGMYRLIAPGFGERPGTDLYGCGALYVWGLTARQTQRFERAIQEQAAAGGGDDVGTR